MKRFLIKLLQPLASMKMGIYSGLLTASLLMLASFFVPDPRSTEAFPFSETLIPFFDPLQWRFVWLYLLIAGTSMYALSTTAHVVLGIVLVRNKNQRWWAIWCMHIGFLLGLATHLVAGLSAGDLGGMVLGKQRTEWRGHTLQLEDVQRTLFPNGRMRTLQASVLVDGTRKTIGHNNPLFFNWGTEYLMMNREATLNALLVKNLDGVQEEYAEGSLIPSDNAILVRISNHPSLRRMMVQLVDQNTGQGNWYALGSTLPSGSLLEDVTKRAGVALLAKRNAGLPLLLLSSLLFVLGLMLYLFAPVPATKPQSDLRVTIS